MGFARIFMAVCMTGAFTLAACHSHRSEGPGQRAGQKVDEGLYKLGDKMQEGGQKLQDKAHGD